MNNWVFNIIFQVPVALGHHFNCICIPSVLQQSQSTKSVFKYLKHHYVYLLSIADTCFGLTRAIIRQHLLCVETTALHTLSFVPIGTTLLLLLICFIGYFYRIFWAAISVFLFSIVHLCIFWCWLTLTPKP
jgi:hypothetical protein